jgi:hypothetical protein
MYAYLEKLGVSVRTNTAVQRIAAVHNGVVGVECQDTQGVKCRFTFDKLVSLFYTPCSRVRVIFTLVVVLSTAHAQGKDYALRFYGNGANNIDRVKIRLDDPATSSPGPPADIGAENFTLEFWMRASAAENTAAAINCGQNINWIYGNIVFDRDRFNQDRKYGIAIAGGRVVFGVSGDGTGDRTICSTIYVLNDSWHHIAVQRRRADGWMWLYVDGRLEAQADGPDGDISYPDNGIPGDFCDGPCSNSDPYLVIGAEKHDAGAVFPSYSGWIDEVRLSNTLRYGENFTPPAQPFTADAMTVALYHFDEGRGNTVLDTSDAQEGPTHGVRHYGGSPAGPSWSNITPFRPQTALAPCHGLLPTIVGTDGSDNLAGTPDNDVIDGRGGHDIIRGGGGDDVICGRSGHDILIGGAGNDILVGGGGHDILIGGAGNDILMGGGGDDVCNGSSDVDTASGCESFINVP